MYTYITDVPTQHWYLRAEYVFSRPFATLFFGVHKDFSPYASNASNAACLLASCRLTWVQASSWAVSISVHSNEKCSNVVVKLTVRPHYTPSNRNVPLRSLNSFHQRIVHPKKSCTVRRPRCTTSKVYEKFKSILRSTIRFRWRILSTILESNFAESGNRTIFPSIRLSFLK